MANISQTDICNRALQLLGQEVITSLSQNNKNARSVALAYDICRRAELRAHPWNFSIKRASLAESPTPPLWGKAHSFPLPADFLRLMPADNSDYPSLFPTTPGLNSSQIDYEIEQNAISTNFPAPLQIRYIFDCIDTSLFDDLFNECLAARIAEATCEQITQSNAKLQAISTFYKDKSNEARKVNAWENISAKPPEDTYLTARLWGGHWNG